MPKFAFFLACLFFGNLLYAQPAATGSISGRITVKQQPLAGITVTLESPGSTSVVELRKAFSTKTDSDGRYRFAAVPKGQYVVAPRAAAYVLPLGGVLIRAGKDVTVGENEQLENIDFDLTRGGVITGKITDHTGRPMIQQRVSLKLRGANNQWRNYFSPSYSMHQTDDRGVFRLYGLPAGQYLVNVGEARNDGSITVGRAGGYLPLTYFPGTPNEAEAKPVEVTEGGEVTDIDIKVGKPEKTYEVRGRILDGTTGAPLIGVQFSHGTIQPGPPPRIGSYGTTGERTNAQGEFIAQSIKPGKYAIFMQPEVGSEYYSEPTVFEVLEGDVEGVEIKAYRGASISGQVVIEGTTDPAILQRVKEVTVAAYSASPTTLQAPPFGRPLMNPDGTFHLTGLRPGRTRLSASARSTLQLLRIEREGMEQPREIELTAGEQLTGFKVVMGYGTGVIRGQLNVVGGTLPPEVRFRVMPTRVDATGHAISSTMGGLNGPLQLDARGRFVVEDVLPGEYDVRLIPIGTPGGPSLRNVRIEPQRVTVSTGEVTVTFTLNLGEKKEGQQ